MARIDEALARSEGTAAEKAFWAAELRTMAVTCGTELEAMGAQAKRLMALAPPEFAHEAGTLAVNAFICAGRYDEALEVEGWAEARAGGVTPDDEGQPFLMQINLAEADYNLGRWGDAARRLDRVAEEELWAPLLIGGVICQRAWIGARTGDPAPARAFLEQFDLDWLPRLYRAELHYCAAVCHAVLGAPDEALAAAQTGQAEAIRASSHRNGHFLRAGLLEARGDVDGALVAYEAGASAGYRGQGGEALWAWGSCLLHAGREDEAHRAWALAVERDPQSESARLAESAIRSRRRG